MKNKLIFILGFLFLFGVIVCAYGAPITLERFRERYNEIRQDSQFGNLSTSLAVYAGSTVTLERFRERYNEIQRDSQFGNLSTSLAFYAAAN